MRETEEGSQKKSATVQSQWPTMGRCADTPWQNGERVSQHHQLLFQFFLHEFLQSFETLTKMKRCSFSHRKPHLKTLIGNDFSYVSKDIELNQSILPARPAPPLCYQCGSLKKLLHYFSFLKPLFSHEQHLGHDATEKLYRAILSTIDCTEEYARLLSREREGSLNQMAESLYAQFQMIASFFSAQIFQFRTHENVIFFLCVHHEQIDRLYQKNYVQQILKEIFPEGLNKAKHFLTARFVNRGFHHLLPTIDRLSKELGCEKI